MNDPIHQGEHVPLDLRAKLLSRYIPEPVWGCWLWEYGVATNGYGMVHYEYKMLPVHRLSYEIHYGEIPDGLLVCHKCDIKTCINPDHLYLGTHLDNRRDAVKRGQQPRGLRIGNAWIPDEVVIQIREATGTYQSIADHFGTSLSQAWRIKNRHQRT